MHRFRYMQNFIYSTRCLDFILGQCLDFVNIICCASCKYINRIYKLLYLCTNAYIHNHWDVYIWEYVCVNIRCEIAPTSFNY